jgi:PAS domain S-box-containing protein
MADSATAKELTRQAASFGRRYGLAFASVAGALLLDLVFQHFNLPHPFAAFALSAIAITFWYGGTKPGVVAVLLSSLIRGFIFEGETSSLSRVLYELVFLTFAILMIWVRRRKEALEVAIVDRTTELTAANEDLHKRKEQIDALFELSPDAVILTDDDFHVLRVNKEFTRIFGYTAEEVAGQWLPDLIVPEELRAEAFDYRDRLSSGNRVELEAIRQRKDGVRFDVSVVARGISLGFDHGAVYLIYRDITERKKAERELRRSEGYLAEAQKLTHTGSWAWNMRTGVLFWSREIFSIYDCEYQEMGPTWPQFLERVHPEDRPQVEQRARIEASGRDWLDSQIDFRIILPDGTIKHLHSVAHPVRDDSGEVTEVVGTVMDVTEQWKARTELEKAFEEIKQRTEAARRSEREFRDVVNTVPAHVWRTSPDGQVDFVNDRWLQFTGLAFDEAFGWTWEAVLHPDDRTRVVTDWHTALKNGQAMESESRVRRADGKYCWWFIRNVPLRDETGKLVRWYGTAIDIEDRKQAEQALRKSEERWRSVFENSAIGVALADLNGRFLATNHVYQTMVGYREEELRALSFLDVTHEDHREANWALITELLEGKRQQFQIEKKYLRKDGSSVWVNNNVSLVPGTERVPQFIMALSEDITQRKRAEEALQRSEAYLAEAQKLTHTGSWVWNVRTDALFWSQEVFRIYDYDPEKMAHPTWDFFERVHPEDRPNFEQRKKRMASTQKERADSEIDYRIVLPDGTIKHLHSIAHPVIESGDEVVGTVMDVTEQWKARAKLEKAFEEIKQRTEALRRSEGYLAEAQKLTHTGSWAVRVPQTENAQREAGQGLAVIPRFGWDASYWSNEMYRIFGFDPGPTTPSYVEIVQRMHPEDAHHNTPVVEQAIRDRTDFENDFRLLLPNGASKYIHVVGHPVVNASGDVIELVGTAMDVTEQHEARAALQTAFEQIKAEETELRRMTDAIASYIYVLRPDGTAFYANQTVLDYTGLTLEDVRREDQRARVFHLEDMERLREERLEAFARGKPFELEIRALGKDGKYRWFLVRYNPLRDDQGQIIRWYATGTDIEDRKRAEERMRDENLALREQIDQAFMFEEIVGSSSALQTVLSSIVKVAPTDSTVLITGETGTGKELIARAIHKHSQRSGQAFISVNCASIPSSLIASELFGHEKGAFTGAVQRRQGRFELAHSGTIFLDEVGDLPAEAQIILLRVLQERQFERVGGNRILTTDVRVISATNRDLTAAIAAGTFRSDLFYRLNVFPIEVPPLRMRKEDIPILVEYFVKRYAEKAGKQICKIDKNTLELCQSYPWPGNIRELQNIVERSVILTSGDTFCIEEAWLASPEPVRQELPAPLPDTLQNQEREIIETALAECNGKIAGPKGAAAKLGIPRSTLDSKIKQLKIKKHKFISAQ